MNTDQIIMQISIEGNLYTDKEIRGKYDNFLNHNFGMVHVALHSYNTSDVLKAVDPVSYRLRFDGWLLSGRWRQLGIYYTTLEDIELAKSAIWERKMEIDDYMGNGVNCSK